MTKRIVFFCAVLAILALPLAVYAQPTRGTAGAGAATFLAGLDVLVTMKPTWIEFARMPFDLGDPPAVSTSFHLIGEARIGPAHIIRRTANGAFEQISDPFPARRGLSADVWRI
jgi:hypothetical protein